MLYLTLVLTESDSRRTFKGRTLTDFEPGGRGEVMRIEREESQTLKMAQPAWCPVLAFVMEEPSQWSSAHFVGDANYAVGRDVAERVMVRRDS